MDILKGKKGIVIGVANERSICWGIANECIQNGAEIAISYLDITKSRVEKLVEGTSAITYKCDCSNDDSVNDFYNFVKEKFENIDFIVCGPAFANKEALNGDYMNVSRSDFLQAMDISIYSLTAVCKVFSPIINENGSIITLTYYGSEKFIPNYNVMGVAKAGLEASVRYLAGDFGKRGIRVNSISAGPVKTLASSAIGDFKKVLNFGEKCSLMKKNVSQEDIGKTAVYLLSDLSSGITAENIHVDCGLSSVGMFIEEEN